MTMRRGLIGLLLLFVPLGFAFAQSDTVPAADTDDGSETTIVGEEDVSIPNTVACFDYYSFGSVQANLSASVAGTVSGAPITFSGQLVNTNPYPIVDGALYVKVFKSRGATNDGNGPDVVDQFLVKGDIVIPAGSSVPVSFQWRVPSFAQSGDYELATFFTTSRKFNLLGLSFTDDVVGNTVPFTVSGEQTGIVKFDKTGVTIAGNPYLFAAFPPRVDAKAPVTLEATVNNTTGSAQQGTISWTVYQWDAQLRENAVQEESHPMTFPAGTSKVSIVVTDSSYPVYYVVGTVSWKDTKSVIGARFVRDGVDRTRINFPGVTAFPLKAGVGVTLFSCLHNSGDSSVVQGGSLDLTLTDRDGNLIKEYRYEGDVSSAMMGVATQFVPDRDYDYFTLNARLYQGDQFVDEANLVYDCEAIDPSQCNPAPVPGAANIFTSPQSLLAIGGLVIILLIVLWIYRRMMRRPAPNTTQLPPM